MEENLLNFANIAFSIIFIFATMYLLYKNSNGIYKYFFILFGSLLMIHLSENNYFVKLWTCISILSSAFIMYEIRKVLDLKNKKEEL